MNVQAALPTVDVREIAPRDRHPLVFSKFRGLSADEAMELVNDHDLRPLYDQFQAEIPGKFTWDDLDSGPDAWRVRLSKVAGGHSNGQCCGSCGGA